MGCIGVCSRRLAKWGACGLARSWQEAESDLPACLCMKQVSGRRLRGSVLEPSEDGIGRLDCRGRGQSLLGLLGCNQTTGEWRSGVATHRSSSAGAGRRRAPAATWRLLESTLQRSDKKAPLKRPAFHLGADSAGCSSGRFVLSVASDHGLTGETFKPLKAFRSGNSCT